MGRDSRVAFVRIGADDRGFKNTLRSTEKAAQTWSSRVKGRISGAFRDAFGGLGNVVGLGGVAAFASIARDVKTFNDRLVRLQISSNRSRGEMMKFNAELQETAQRTGVSADTLLGGAEKYQELTGKLGDFTSQLQMFAAVASGTGASMEDISTAAAALTQNLKVDPTQLSRVFDIFTQQGKDGAVEFKNLAEELSGLTGQFATFGARGEAGAAQLGAFLQVIRRGAPSAAEAATQLTSIMNELTNSKNIEALEEKGIKVWANKAKGELRDLGVIVEEVVTKIPTAQLSDIFGRSESRKGLVTLANPENMRMLHEMQDTTGKIGVVARDAAEWQASAGARIAMVQAKFKAVFTKAILDNADALVRAFEGVVKALTWIAEHPEALATIAVLWKGGGGLRGLGALAGGGGGAGALGEAAAASAGGMAGIGGRVASRAGGVMQGIAVGLALDAVGQKTGDSLDSLSESGMMAAGALAGFGGAVGAVGIAIMGIKLMSDAALAAIDARQDREAKSIWGERPRSDAAALGTLGAGAAREIFDPVTGQTKTIDTGKFDAKAYYRMRMSSPLLGITPEMKASAEFMMRKGKNEGFVDKFGNVDIEKVRASVDADETLDAGKRLQIMQQMQFAEEIMRNDPEMFYRTLNYNLPAGATPFAPPAETGYFPDALAEMEGAAPGTGMPRSFQDKPTIIGQAGNFMRNMTTPSPIEIRVIVPPNFEVQDNLKSRGKHHR